MEHGVDFEFRIANFEFEKAWSMGHGAEDRGQRTENGFTEIRREKRERREREDYFGLRIANCGFRIAELQM
jgi:hypothetical protein